MATMADTSVTRLDRLWYQWKKSQRMRVYNEVVGQTRCLVFRILSQCPAIPLPRT